MTPRAAALGSLLALAVALPGAAGAALGEPLASVQGEGIRMAAAVRQTNAFGARVHLLQLADGSVVRQYSGADGRVFAVAWNTRTKPRLDELLGAHFENYADAARQAQQQRPGARHSVAIRQGDLVVEATAHANAFVGRAYLRSLLPAGQPADAWR